MFHSTQAGSNSKSYCASANCLLFCVLRSITNVKYQFLVQILIFERKIALKKGSERKIALYYHFYIFLSIKQLVPLSCMYMDYTSLRIIYSNYDRFSVKFVRMFLTWWLCKWNVAPENLNIFVKLFIFSLLVE